MASPAVAATVETQQPSALKLENVLYQKKGVIAYVTLDRPKVLNALNTPTWRDLRTTFDTIGTASSDFRIVSLKSSSSR